MAQPLDYIRSARKLIGRGHSRRPRQSDLRRAISTAYYAMFHTLCINCADCLIGGTRAARSDRAWRQAYRAIEHGFAKSQCKNGSILARFPREVEDFAQAFVTLQEKRHDADYDPFARFSLTDAINAIDQAEGAIRGFKGVSISDRRAFAAWTAMKHRNS